MSGYVTITMEVDDLETKSIHSLTWYEKKDEKTIVNDITEVTICFLEDYHPEIIREILKRNKDN